MERERIMEAYPLTWPEGQPRTPLSRRKGSQFKAGFAQARDELLAELRRLGAQRVILSTNVRLRRDGLPLASESEPDDGAAAVYFTRRGQEYVIACDTYSKVRHNVRAIGATVEALRAIERHGSTQMMEQAFTGFAALPPAHAAAASWWETLGVTPEATDDELRAARERLALEHHPDRGGDSARMAEINAAFDRAMEGR